MRLVIRTEAGGDNGLGHVMRMREVAESIYDLDDMTDITFVARSQEVARLVAPFETLTINTHTDDRILWEVTGPGDVVVLDHVGHYYDDGNLRRLRDEGQRKIVRVEQTAAEADSADLLLVCSFHLPAFQVDNLRTMWGERLLYGPEYVIIRQAVRELAPLRYSQRQPWLVFTSGGSDPDSALLTLYASTRELSDVLPHAHRWFCYGRLAKPRYYQDLDPRASLTGFHPNYLRRARLVVSLFGNTSYEALYFHTPLITIGATSHNVAAGAYLAAATSGASVNIDEPLVNLSASGLCALIRELWNNPDTLHRMHQAASWLDLESGSHLIAERLLKLGGTL